MPPKKEAADIEDFESFESRKVWAFKTDAVTTFVCNEPEYLGGLAVVEYQVLSTTQAPPKFFLSHRAPYTDTYTNNNRNSPYLCRVSTRACRP